MSHFQTVLAMSENQSSWVATLVAGFVVLLVVIALLEGLKRTVAKLNDDIWKTWENGAAVVKNTGGTYLLKNTHDSSDELVDELSNHGS